MKFPYNNIKVSILLAFALFSSFSISCSRKSCPVPDKDNQPAHMDKVSANDELVADRIIKEYFGIPDSEKTYIYKCPYHNPPPHWVKVLTNQEYINNGIASCYIDYKRIPMNAKDATTWRDMMTEDTKYDLIIGDTIDENADILYIPVNKYTYAFVTPGSDKVFNVNKESLIALFKDKGHLSREDMKEYIGDVRDIVHGDGLRIYSLDKEALKEKWVHFRRIYP